MKYIKKYSSLIVESVKDDLKDFCEWNLAYLMDDDYKVMIIRRDSLYHKKGLIIYFYRWYQGDTFLVSHREGFNWVEVENHFIPFLQRLSKEYTLVECQIDYRIKFGRGVTKYIVPIEDLLNGILPKGLIDRILVIVEEE